MDAGGRQVKTVARAFEIVETIEERDGMRLTDVADEMDVSPSTAHEYLTTLEDLGYLVREDGEFALGLRFLTRGICARNRHAIVPASEPVIEQLAEEIADVAVWVAVEERGMAIYLDKAIGEQAIQTHARVGTHSHLHYLASGKAILAHLPDERVEAIIDRHGLPPRTEHSITDEETLFAELERVRDRGYGINDAEATPGTRAVASPVIVDGEVVGAVSITGPRTRLDDETIESTLVERLLAATNEIEVKLGHSID